MWTQLQNGSGNIYRLETNNDPCITSKSFRCASFSQLAFAVDEERLIVTDTQGYVYQLEFRNFDDIMYSKFGNFAMPTCIAFNPLEQSEILLALKTNDVIICKHISENMLISAQLSSHCFPILHITFYKQYCLTASSKEAIIWNLNNFVKVHHLQLQFTSINLRKASFSSYGHIAVLYSNDALQIWSWEDLTEDSRVSFRDIGVRHVKDFIFTWDGGAIIICAVKGGICVLDTACFKLIASFNMAASSLIPKQICIIPHPCDVRAATILAIHCFDSSLQFLDLSNGNFIKVKDIFWRGIKQFIISAQGRWMACIELNGSISLCRIDRLFYEKETTEKKRKLIKVRSKVHQINDHLWSVKQNMREELRLCRMLPILEEFKEYPGKYRTAIWSNIMELPMNRQACSELTKNVSQNSLIRDMLRDYPLTDQCQASLLATTIDRLVRWCSFLGNCQFLPTLVFPFLIVFQKNRLLALEASITVITNFCQKWFEYYPLPPLNILGIVENILLETDPALLTYFCERGITSTDYAWPLLQTTLSEVLTANEWLLLWDHILSYRRPSFLLMCVASYSICCRRTIMSLVHNSNDFRRFYSTQGNLSVKKLLKFAQSLDQNIPEHIHPDRYLRNNFTVLPNEKPYPLLLMYEYPTFLIEK